MGKKAKMTVTTPETSTGNEHHRRGEKPTNQTQGRAPKKGSDSTRRSHDSGSTSGQTDDRTPQRRHNITSKSELVTKNVDNIDDEGYLLHEAKRRRKRPLPYHLAAHAQGRQHARPQSEEQEPKDAIANERDANAG
jgi:hypothetical protein